MGEGAKGRARKRRFEVMLLMPVGVSPAAQVGSALLPR